MPGAGSSDIFWIIKLPLQPGEENLDLIPISDKETEACYEDYVVSLEWKLPEGKILFFSSVFFTAVAPNLTLGLGT